MRKQYVIQFLLIFAFLIQAMGQDAGPEIDRIEVKGGAVLTGRIVNIGDGQLHLQTDYAGKINVKIAQVQRIITKQELGDSVPAGLIAIPKSAAPKQPLATSTGAAKPPVVKKTPATSTAATKPPVKKPPAKKPAAANDKYGWDLEIGMNLVGSAGNTDKLDFGLNIDTEYEQKFYRIDLYAGYTYGTNRDRLTSNEIIIGSRYTNFFYKRFGFFIREELEHDKFEGIDIRSTTASGFSYKLYDTKELDFEARSGLSYRYEEDDRGRQQDFPGMDFGIDSQWQFTPYLSFKGSYSFIPSFNDSEEFIVTQNSAIDIPFDRKSLWKLRLGLTSKYNNKPRKNRENLDHKYFVRLIATWK